MNISMEESVNKTTGLWERTKTALHLDNFKGKFGQYKDILFEVALYGGLGFLIGFLTRRYSSHILLFISFFVLIFLLVRFDLIVLVVNWERLNELFGIQGVMVDESNIFASLWLWVQHNVAMSISFVVGFLIGLKFG